MASVRATIIEKPKPLSYQPFRFAACLSFLEAYYHFVVDGTWIGIFILAAYAGIPEWHYLLLWITQLLRPIIFAALGLSLWHGRKSLMPLFWLAVGICVAGVIALWLYQINVCVSCPADRGAVAMATRLLHHATLPAFKQLPWFALATAGYWCYRVGPRSLWDQRHPWVILASTWFAAQALLSLNMDVAPPWSSEIVPLPKACRSTAGLLTSVLFAAVAIALHYQWRFSRWLILAVGVVAIGGLFYWDMQLYDYELQTKGFTRWFVLWQRVCMPGFVLAAGQWVIAAYFAFRVPMYVAPDDGSPYPRVYCGRCHYNLHGIYSSRCPECGTELAGQAARFGSG